ncbi:hypothetical protein RYX36_006084, partial [Vicia faba]
NCVSKILARLIHLTGYTNGTFLWRPKPPTAGRQVNDGLNYYCNTVMSRGTWARSSAEDASPNYNSNAEDNRFSWGLIPVRWLLLRESLLDGSRYFVMHTKYRISLRSSSMQEPIYPLTRVILYHVSKHNPHENCLWCHAGALRAKFKFLDTFSIGGLSFGAEENILRRSPLNQ